MDSQAVEKFFHRLFDGLQSLDGKPLYLCIVGIKTGGDNKKEVIPRYYKWPNEASVAVGVAAALDKSGCDVYFCAHLLTAMERKKAFAAPVHCLWVDDDGDADLTKGPTPSVVVQSSPGHRHAYYRLNKAIEPQRAEQLNRRLAHKVGADKSGYDLTQLLRVPSTRNHKPERAAANGGQPPEVVILASGTAKEYDPDELERALPELPPPPPRVESEPGGPPVKLSPRGLDLWYGRKMILKDDGTEEDRSDTLFAIACELARGGVASEEWIGRALADRDVSLPFKKGPKFADRPEEYMRAAAKALAAAAVNAQTAKAVPAQAVPAQVRQVVLPPLRSLSEFDEKPSPPPKWVVERLFLENQIGLICGPPYAGKSLFAMDVGISIASQAKVVGHPKLQVPRSRGVAYIYAEQGDQQWERSAFAVARCKGTRADIPFHLVSGYEMDLTKRLERLEFIRLLRDRGVEVCIFDPLAVLFRCEDENDASKVILAARRPLQHFVQEGIVPVVVHHATKDAARYEPDTADKLVRGSNDIIAMTGSIIGVWDGKNKGVKVTAQGRGPMVYPFKLRREPTESYPLKQDSGGWLLVDEQIMSEQVPVLVYDGEWREGSPESWLAELAALPDEFRTSDAEGLWGVSSPTARGRLRILASREYLKEAPGRGRLGSKWVKCAPAPSADAEEEDEE